MLASWTTIPGVSDLRTIWLGFSKTPVKISYMVSPLARANNVHGKMIGFINRDYGYIRGMNVLYTPIGIKELLGILIYQNVQLHDSGSAQIQFNMPKGFKVNLPLVNNEEQIDFAVLRNTYIGLGNLQVYQRNWDGINLSIAVYKGFERRVHKKYLYLIPSAYNEIYRMTNLKPKDSSKMTITILPHEMTYGGSAGIYSIVSEDSEDTVVHEMFHWWNGMTLQIASDATWIKEGFTTYFTGKILMKSGVWSETRFADYMRGLETEFAATYRRLKLTGWNAVDIVRSSKRYISGKGNKDDYILVYNGGALIAYYLDQQLKKEEKDFDNIWIGLSVLRRTITTKSFMDTLERMYGKNIADDCTRILKGQKEIVDFDK